MTLAIQLGSLFCLGIIFAQKLRIVGLSVILVVVCGFNAATASGDHALSTIGTCVGQIVAIQIGFGLGVWIRAVIAPIFFRTARAG